MKNVFITLLFSALITGCAMTKPIAETDREQIFVVDVPNKTQSEIIKSAKVWIAQNYNSANAVTEYKDENRIIGNGSGIYPCKGLDCIGYEGWNYKYTMTIDAKDNKYRIVFSNIGVIIPPSNSSGYYFAGYSGLIRNQKELMDIKPELERISKGIYESMNKKINQVSEDW